MPQSPDNRLAFRRCLTKYKLAQLQARISFTPMVRRSLPAMEYCADFILTLRRELPAKEWEVVQAYHLDGINYRRCALLLRWPVESFHRRLYTVEGHAGIALQTNGLFPTHKYFNRSQRRKSVYLSSIENEMRLAA